MKHKKQASHVSHERWLVSYADFITLLFAFFVVLFSTSQADKKKVEQVEYSIQSAFQNMGIFPAVSSSPNLANISGTPNTATVMMGDDLDVSPKDMADLNKMKTHLDNLLSEEIAHKTVTVQVGRDGLIISLRAAGFFESASAIPIPDSLHTLHAIGSALATTPYDIRIEGHTDNVPIHDSKFPSNWELSTARATELTQLFIEDCHVVPVHLSAAGYAEFHPVASNATAEGRNRNRRVDIIVLPHRDHHPELHMDYQAGRPLEGAPGRPAAGNTRPVNLSPSAMGGGAAQGPGGKVVPWRGPPLAAASPVLQNGPVPVDAKQQLLGTLYALQAQTQGHGPKAGKSAPAIPSPSTSQ
jgi:chemotaxis protein MotB